MSTTSALLHEFEALNFWTALIIIPVLYVLSVIIYRIWFHPLAKYPGPFLGKFTDIYPMVAMFKMTRVYWQYEMLQKYGSPVRVSTNNLFFSDMKSWNDIYGQSSNYCPKESVFYDHLSATGAKSVLNIKEKGEHARVRRLLSHAFSLNALLKSESLVQQKVQELNDIVFKPAAQTGQITDIFDKMMSHFLDISSYFSIGRSFDSLSGRGEITSEEMDCL